MDRFADIVGDLTREEVNTHLNGSDWLAVDILQINPGEEIIGFDLVQVDGFDDGDVISTTDPLPVLCAHQTSRGVQLVLADHSTIMLSELVSRAVKSVVEGRLAMAA